MSPAHPQLLIDRAQAARRLGERIRIGHELCDRPISCLDELEAAASDYRRWNAYNVEVLQQIFSTSRFADEYAFLRVTGVGLDESPAQQIAELKAEIREKILRLETVHDRLELLVVASNAPVLGTATANAAKPARVFVVHGHDEAAKESVARLLERLKIEAVILHEQATGGRTIIEKLEHYADVDFAIVLLTPDDIGAVKSNGSDKLQARARQNVVFELGYFAGKLTRRHVCALYKGSLELPSDYVGVVYISFDEAGAWRFEVAKELREAGLTIDMNLLH